MYNCGIYQIRNIVNGKCYVGQSKNIPERITTHKRALTRNKHENVYLQYAYNKYGGENFVFEPLMYCPQEDLDKYEKLFMAIDTRKKKAYNILVKQYPKKNRVNRLRQERDDYTLTLDEMREILYIYYIDGIEMKEVYEKFPHASESLISKVIYGDLHPYVLNEFLEKYPGANANKNQILSEDDAWRILEWYYIDFMEIDDICSKILHGNKKHIQCIINGKIWKEPFKKFKSKHPSNIKKRKEIEDRKKNAKREFAENILTLHFIKGQSVKEISLALDVGYASVSSIVKGCRYGKMYHSFYEKNKDIILAKPVGKYNYSTEDDILEMLKLHYIDGNPVPRIVDMYPEKDASTVRSIIKGRIHKDIYNKFIKENNITNNKN